MRAGSPGESSVRTSTSSPSTRLCRVNVLGGSEPSGLPSTRLCRVKAVGDSRLIALSSTRLCTDQFIRAELPDKMPCVTTFASQLRLTEQATISDKQIFHVRSRESKL